MRKIVIIKWDMQVGPQNIAQFPPEEKFPPKEILLKMWASFEMVPDSKFISMNDEKNQHFYCSLLKTQEITNNTYFIILELDSKSDVRIYQEILTNIADDLINNILKPQFSHILSESYRIIKNYSDLDENQLFLRLFKDKIRIDILKILRKGVITKINLEKKLKDQYGLVNVNLDLLLVPFFRLGLISNEDIAGASSSILLKKDVYCCRLPPKNKPSNELITERIRSLFSNTQIIDTDSLDKLVTIFQASGVKELFSLLNEDVSNGMPYEVALEVVKNDVDTLKKLEEEDFLYNFNEQTLFLISNLNFISIKPKYLCKILSKRYNDKEISLDQMMRQIKILEK